MATLKKEEIASLQSFADKIRKYALFTMAKLGVGHVGGSMSICEILAYLYGKEMNIDSKNPNKEDRDMYIQSKGHAGPAVYSALAIKGFFPEEWLNTLNQGATRLPSHCDKNQTPGIDMSTGSLGQGLSVACGCAYGMKLKNSSQKMYVLVGDGESQEGQNWEAAMFAAQKKLDNIIAITDRNKMQIDGCVDDICSLGDLAAKWKAFGWQVETADGHDFESINKAFEACHNSNGLPKMIIMDTIKGKGFPRLENQVSSHNATLTVDECKELYNGEGPAWLN